MVFSLLPQGWTRNLGQPVLPLGTGTNKKIGRSPKQGQSESFSGINIGALKAFLLELKH